MSIKIVSDTLDYDEYRNPVVALEIKDNEKFYNITTVRI